MAERAPPTPMAMIISTALIAGVSGYLIGIGSGLGIFPNPFGPKQSTRRGVDNYDDEEESEEEEIDATILDHAPNWSNGFEADKRDGLRATAATKTREVKSEKAEKAEKVDIKREEVGEVGMAQLKAGEECKMILVVRTDLGMTKGLSSFPTSKELSILTIRRQDRSAMRTRYTCVL